MPAQALTLDTSPAPLTRLETFTAEAERLLTQRGPEALGDLRSQLRALATSGLVEELLRSELARMREDPHYVPRGSADTLTLFQCPHFRLLLKAFRKGSGVERDQLVGRAEHLMIAVAGPAPLELDLYREAAAEREDVFDATRQLSGPTRRLIAPGTVACFVAGRDVLLPVSPPETTFALVLTSQRVRPMQWVYSGTTLTAERLVSADPTASRLDFAAQLLGELGSTSSVPALRRLCEYPAHFVRWSAVRSLMRLDFDEGLQAVREAVTDSHPHVRNAAQRALEQLAAEGLLSSSPGRSRHGHRPRS